LCKSIGFGAVTTFIALLFASRGWERAWLAFSGFSLAFVSARVVFGHLPDQVRGASVALVSLLLESAGLLLIGIAPSNAYRCIDGYVLIAGNGDSIFKRLMQVIGRDELAADPELANNAGRVARVAELDAAIGVWTATRPVGEVLEVLGQAKVPAGKVYTDLRRDAATPAKTACNASSGTPATRKQKPAPTWSRSAKTGIMSRHFARAGCGLASPT
jgi:crotonobetainyl-CoA:carnitine CoA-transferase CaiB-like acyl-CoA transferase